VVDQRASEQTPRPVTVSAPDGQSRVGTAGNNRH
jgi:hypothetical protein